MCLKCHLHFSQCTPLIELIGITIKLFKRVLPIHIKPFF